MVVICNLEHFDVTFASGHVELAHLLLEQGANVENRTKKGYTPFFLASKEVTCAFFVDLDAT